MRKILPLTALLCLSLAACTKDDNLKRATVIDMGDVSNEGCGWILRMEDGKDEKPDYLPSAFQHNDLKVKVDLGLIDVLDTCEYSVPRRVYQIVTIKKIVRDN